MKTNLVISCFILISFKLYYRAEITPLILEARLA